MVCGGFWEKQERRVDWIEVSICWRRTGIRESEVAGCELGTDSGTCEVEVAERSNAGTGGRGRTGVTGTWAPLGAGALSACSVWLVVA